MPQFILKIELGNETMSAGYDIADALKKVSDHIYNHGCSPYQADPITILDKNGNKVGYYEVTE